MTQNNYTTLDQFSHIRLRPNNTLFSQARVLMEVPFKEGSPASPHE